MYPKIKPYRTKSLKHKMRFLYPKTTPFYVGTVFAFSLCEIIHKTKCMKY